MRELKITVHDADPAYVEEKVGVELYTHLRAVPANVTSRRAAIERAHALYGNTAGGMESRRSAAGLLVLQRSMLAVEDLGGLMVAYADPPDFGRLVSYDLGDISAEFDALFRNPESVAHIYRFPTPGSIDSEARLSDSERVAMHRLRTLTLAHVREKFVLIRHFWQTLHHAAKKTMHGVGFMAGEHALGDPGCGAVGALLDPGHVRPFAVALDTHVDHAGRHVETRVSTIDLSPPAVERMSEAGVAACDATEIFAAGRLYGLQTNHAYSLPRQYLDELDPADEGVLAPLFDA